MLKNDRLTFITDYLKKHQTAKVGFLSDQLSVTPETVRRDLEVLEESGEIKRVHGGAMLKQANITETNFEIRESINKNEKELIAEEACHFVKEGDFIAMDVSTTNTEIAIQLARQFSQLSVLTNSLVIATILGKNSNIDVYLPSGKLRNSELCVLGASCISYINQFHIDTFFMSVSGISLEKGLMDYGYGESEVKMAMYNNAINKFVVADHTKFESTAMLRVGDVHLVNGIITDPMISPAIVKKYEEKDIHIFHSSQ
ncbi:DeoR family transcriptional regulator [Oceanobacillus sp. 143]|uniref:DeoR/GlpR transcriptional regulator n=1 Tax=Oceanobacillus zhaokaii TaxID=2052660 RepID=A0A345PJW9_9BACI|nr:DeoR/GlpR family DNA-binding transcription regulator [Oceanobacillus zhaokaii]AXI10299.1 DeoR/GlpR transcriptional regulator [Oceanobacillus zhaokaii]QGS69352.1 DeoR family transcriptional regulator [Oceanobacillus sp. 143]